MFQFLGIVTFFAGLVYLATAVGKLFERFDVARSPAPIVLKRPDGPFTLHSAFPWRRRWQRRRVLWNQTRKTSSWEVFWELSPVTPDSHLWLPVSRRVHKIEISGPETMGAGLKDLVFSHEGQDVRADLAGRVLRRKGKKFIEIEFAEGLELTRIDIGFTEPINQDEMEAVLTVSTGDADFNLLQKADRGIKGQMWDSVFQALSSYEKYSKENPLVCYWLGQCHLSHQDWSSAEEYGLRLAALDRLGPGEEIYIRAKEAMGWVRSDGGIAKLKSEAADWDIPGHHGLATLLVHHHFVTGLSNCHREQCHIILEVRRRAAARKLRSVGFSWEGGRAFLLHTAVRIIRANGSSEFLPQDRFVQGNAEDDNLFITVDRREAGNWILPDLAVGDLVEYTYSLLRRDHNNEAGFFILENVTDVANPTLSGIVEITWPHDWELKFSTLNADEVVEYRREPDRKKGLARFEVRRQPVRTVSGNPYQSRTLNPVFACAKSGLSWSEAAKNLETGNFPPNFEEIELSGELSEVIAEAPDSTTALARGFYWVRDHIKYGSLRSGNNRLLDTDRAAAIDEARIGDCKDKTFLLALICRHLGIPFEQVLVSVRNGMVVEDLPADQFDHVILRAKVDGAWRYLDAAGSLDTFTNVPVGLQGLKGLVLGEGGRLIEIPVDTMAVNPLRITEQITLEDESWLVSDIELEMAGPFGRYFDEQWKYHSLTNPGENRALENALAMVLPGLTVLGFERLADTGHGDICHLRVQGRRARLTHLTDRRVAMCEIFIPSIPVKGYREQELGDEFTFSICQAVDWRMELDDRLAAEFGGYSRFEQRDFGFGRTVRGSFPGGNGMRMARQLEVSQRVIGGPSISSLPQFFEVVEDYCRVVLVFSGRSADEAIS